VTYPTLAGCGRLCESVAKNLVGQRLESFTRISSAVRKSVEDALTRILTPQRSIDIMREIHAAKAKGKPYTIVFVGVNGVGKSTNLSKVAYWLIQNDIKVTPRPSHAASSSCSPGNFVAGWGLEISSQWCLDLRSPIKNLSCI
jgi:hypothetical protein